jgi:glutathione S-transferase
VLIFFTKQLVFIVMNLYNFPSSPFGAKVLAVIYACGLQKSVQVIETHPWKSNSGLRAMNPLNKIPVLELDDGEVIFDSAVICEYLIEISGNPKLWGANRLQTLKMQALIDGAIDSAVLMRYERFFKPRYLQSEDWYERQKLALVSAIEYIDSNVLSLLNNEILFANICASMMVSYIELRFKDQPWRKNYYNLYNWYDSYIAQHNFLNECKVKDCPIPDNIECIRK